MAAQIPTMPGHQMRHQCVRDWEREFLEMHRSTDTLALIPGTWCTFLSYFKKSSLEDMFIVWRDGGRKREKTSMWERNIHQLPSVHAPTRNPTFGCVGWLSNQRATVPGQHFRIKHLKGAVRKSPCPCLLSCSSLTSTWQWQGWRQHSLLSQTARN